MTRSCPGAGNAGPALERRPRLSILLPAYNAGSTLAACLRSITRQTETRWECLVVDDGSSDATASIARSFARRDPRFRLLGGEHRGLVEALNRGLAACRGDFVARMDADDLMHRRRLSRQLGVLDDDPGLVAVGCRVRLFPRRGLGDGMRRYERWLDAIRTERDVRREAFVECPVAHPALTIRRDALTAFGYRDRGWPEDYDLVLRLLAAGRRIGVVPERLVSWRSEPGSLSRSSAAYRIERFTACKAAFLASAFLAGDPRYILWGYGSTGRALRRALAEHGRRPAFIVELHPGRLGNRIHGAEVVAPERLAELPRLPLVASVARERARRQIRDRLAALGFLEERDFVCAA